MLSVGSAFTGIGLLDYGLHLAGLTDHRWVCERDDWRRERILAHRFPGAVRYDDVRKLGHDCEPVEVFVGGFPCKGASSAGPQNGFDHPETVLWREMARTVRELRPRYVLVENVANILGLHAGAVWGEVVGDLAALGYDVTWDCIPAAAVGAPHLRDRVLAVASYAAGEDERRNARERFQPDGRADARGDADDAPDTDSARAHTHAAAGPSRSPTSERAGAAADTGGERRQQVAAGAHGDEAANAGWRAHADHKPAGAGEGVVSAAVEWGEYEPAIRRWERTLGRPAPEPLLRGVGPRGTRKLERSRVSALGDGVCVQVGYLAGRHIIDLEQQRLEELAA